MNKQARCAFLMSSCDVYEDLWNPFFECVNTFWNGISYPVFLNSEFKEYIPSQKLGFEVHTLNQLTAKKISWSRRFADVLNRIPQEYIFLVLDDFFLCDYVDESYFEEIMDIMDQDPEIASFQFYGTRIRNADSEKYQRSDRLQYRLLWENGWKTHFVPTIWKKSVLLKWLRSWESIWAFEGYGSERARRWKYKEKVYVVTNPPIYDYLWIKDCSAVINGKWLDEPELTDFFKENQIKIDYEKRGKMTHQEYLDKTMVDIIKKYKPHEIIVKSFNRFRSLF